MLPLSVLAALSRMADQYHDTGKALDAASTAQRVRPAHLFVDNQDALG